jgi:hypothetical protein
LVVQVFGYFFLLKEMCVGFGGLLFFINISLILSFFSYPAMAALPISSSPVALLLLMETTFKTKLLGLW